ncbi:hypothetical protein DVH05_006526 [Phytophthora capsici]|nr:hypothetical protein DVH05_006526 [Phytophthora capsici]
MEAAELLALELCLRDGGANILQEPNASSSSVVTHIVCCRKQPLPQSIGARTPAIRRQQQRNGGEVEDLAEIRRRLPAVADI